MPKDPRIKKLPFIIPDNAIVYMVNGDIARDYDVEFSLGGHYYRYPFIPENEIWVEDTSGHPHDVDADIYHEGFERLLMKYKGMPYEEAHSHAAIEERHLRKERIPVSDLIKNIIKKLQLLQKESLKTAKKDPRIKELPIKLPDNVKVFLVDGDIIRNNYDIEFALGGHHYRNDYIPENEVWVEDTKYEHDIDINIFYEGYERLLMKYRGMSYDSAHPIVSLEEHNLRRERIPVSELTRVIVDKLQKLI